TDTLQVVRIGHPAVESDGLAERDQRRVDPPVAVLGERELVADAGGPIVELDASLIRLDGEAVALSLVLGIAELLDGTRRGRVEPGRTTELAGGFLDIAAAVIGLA